MKYRKLFAVIKSIVIFIIIYFLLSFTVVMLIYEGLFARTEEYEYSPFISVGDLEQKYQTEEITFESRGFLLNGYFFKADSDRLVILGHAKNGSLKDMLPEAYYFLKNGFSVMTFDFTGHSSSGGTSQFGLQQSVYDMENAIDYALNQGYTDIYLYGIGIGGYAAACCSDDENVKGVAAISAFSSISDMTLEYSTKNLSVFGYIEYPVMMLYQFITYGSDINNSAIDAINASSVPVVIVNGTADEEIDYNGSALINAESKIINPDALFISVENGLHLSLMRSAEAVEAINQFNEKAYELYNEFSGEVPVSEIEEVYASVDKEVTGSLNDEFMRKIIDAFSQKSE